MILSIISNLIILIIFFLIFKNWLKKFFNRKAEIYEKRQKEISEIFRRLDHIENQLNSNSKEFDNIYGQLIDLKEETKALWRNINNITGR